MAPVVTPPVRITAPATAARRYGIFSVADPLPMTDPHQAFGGFTYDSTGCGTSRGWPVVCDEATPGAPKVFDANRAETTVKPFVVYTTINCASAGYTPEYLEAKVRQTLINVEQRGVEEGLFNGAIGGVSLGNVPVFAAGAGVPVLTAAANLKTAIGALEEYAHDRYGFIPVIHAPTFVAAHMGAAGLIREGQSTSTLKTTLGSDLSFGAGYANTSPEGVAAAAGHVWMYVTGRVTLWQDPNVFVPPARQILDRSVNQYNLIAERTWAGSFDCFVAAIDVTL